MIKIYDLTSKKSCNCNSCNSTKNVKGIDIGREDSNCIATIILCEGCRCELINSLSESDGWGKLIDIR